MAQSVFYSWQSDINERLNKRLIRKAIDKAIKQINADLVAEDALRAEQDTTGIPGSPDIAREILDRITKSLATVADLTIVHRNERRAFPNPNVMLEFGYAWAKLTDRRVISVFNEAFGNYKQDLPFDLQQKRKPCLFNLPEGSSEEQKRAERDKLAEQLKTQLRDVLAEGRVTTPIVIPGQDAFEFARQDCFKLRPSEHETGRMPNFWIGAIPCGVKPKLGRISQLTDIWPGRRSLATSFLVFETMDDSAADTVSELAPMHQGASRTWQRRGSVDRSHTKFFDDTARLTIRDNGSISLCVKTSLLDPVPHLNSRWIMADLANALRTIHALRTSQSLSCDYAVMIEMRYDEHRRDSVVPVGAGEWQFRYFQDNAPRIPPIVTSEPKATSPQLIGKVETWNEFLHERFVDLHELTGQTTGAPIQFWLVEGSGENVRFK